MHAARAPSPALNLENLPSQLETETETETEMETEPVQDKSSRVEANRVESGLIRARTGSTRTRLVNYIFHLGGAKLASLYNQP